MPVVLDRELDAGTIVVVPGAQPRCCGVSEGIRAGQAAAARVLPLSLKPGQFGTVQPFSVEHFRRVFRARLCRCVCGGHRVTHFSASGLEEVREVVLAFHDDARERGRGGVVQLEVTVGALNVVVPADELE